MPNAITSTRFTTKAIWDYTNSSNKNKMVGICEKATKLQETCNPTLFFEEFFNHIPTLRSIK